MADEARVEDRVYGFAIVVGALGQTVSPRLATAYIRRDRASVRRLLRWMFAIAMVVAVGGVLVGGLLGEWMLGLLYSAQIAARSDDLLLVMVGGGLWCVTSVLGYAATAANRLRRQPIATGIAAAATAASAWWLVPRYGLTGAAWTSVVSGTVILPAYLGVMLVRGDDA